jgi:hypothetical protein
MPLAITRSTANREFHIRRAKIADHSKRENGKRRGYGPENWHELKYFALGKLKNECVRVHGNENIM